VFPSTNMERLVIADSQVIGQDPCIIFHLLYYAIWHTSCNVIFKLSWHYHSFKPSSVEMYSNHESGISIIQSLNEIYNVFLVKVDVEVIVSSHCLMLLNSMLS